MAAPGTLESLQALHSELVAVCEHRFENIHLLEQALDANIREFQNLLDKKPRSNESRKAIQAGKLQVEDDEYQISNEFIDGALQLADFVELDEAEAARVLFYAQEDRTLHDRNLVQRGLIRLFRQQLFMLHCMRCLIQLSVDEDLPEGLQDAFGEMVTTNIFDATPPPRNKKFVPRCMDAMLDIKTRLQQVADRATATNTLSQDSSPETRSAIETLEFMRTTLLEQHEILAYMASNAIVKRHATAQDFKDLLVIVRKMDRYDQILVHFLPLVGAYIATYASIEGAGDFQQAQSLHKEVCRQGQDGVWALTVFHAAVRAWWVIEYSGWFGEDGPASVDQSLNQAQEQKQRGTQLSNALRDGAFDFILAVAVDVKTPDWQDPARMGIRQWLQRKSPSLQTDSIPFSTFFQDCLMVQLESMISGFISNMPDELRNLRTSEDEQRQLSPSHDHDLDLERFCLIIAYAYEGRHEAARDFWDDPESNLAGFLHWASKRASTPLVSAFCEMLHSIAGDEHCATAAHIFLLDEGQSATGRMRKTTSLTWQTLVRELIFFTNKIRERPTPTQTQVPRGGRQMPEQSEYEPESAMMLECYLRLLTTLATHSESARQFVLGNENHLPEVLCRLASSPTHVPRLRSCAFYALQSLTQRKTHEEELTMWKLLEAWAVGQYNVSRADQRQVLSPTSPMDTLQSQLAEVAAGFEEPNAVVHLLTTLLTPAQDASALQDGLSFPEDLGAQYRITGVQPYVDFVLGRVFTKEKDQLDLQQLQLIRLSCLNFAFQSLDSFNEDLIVIGSETSLNVDSIIPTTDLATYIRLHPFSRVMEWMFNSKVLTSLVKTVHQDHEEVASASPESPLILSIMRAIEVITKVLESQHTYVDLVRPLIRDEPGRKWENVSNTTYASFEEGISDQADLIVDLGTYCGMGHPGLTMVSLKLLERISVSSSFSTGWEAQGRRPSRNKAIVALEMGDHVSSIAEAFKADLVLPMDTGRELESPNFHIKIYILDFLYACLKAAPHRPTIAHLLLGFSCQTSTISVKPGDDFDLNTSLFHSLLRVLLETPFGDDQQGMRSWMIELKYGIMRILELLLKSPMSSALVLDELRQNDLLFHLLLREVAIQPELPWEGALVDSPGFWLSPGADAYITYLSVRTVLFEYASIELCATSQRQMLNVKRRLFDALSGRLKGDQDDVIPVPSIFELFDFLPPDGKEWEIPVPQLNHYQSVPQLNHYQSLDLGTCLAEDTDGLQLYNVGKARQMVLLARSESSSKGTVLTEAQVAAIDSEELALLEALEVWNRRQLLVARRLQVLKSWTSALMVMLESSEIKGNSMVSFLLQALQTLLPGLEYCGFDSPDQAVEIARAARVLLYKINVTQLADETTGTRDVAERHGMGNLLGDKLFQLFQVCMHAVGKWGGHSELRTIYYSIGHKYVTDITDREQGSQSSRQKALKTLHVYGERLLNVMCDDAYHGDADCQTAAIVLLGSLTHLSRMEQDDYVVNALDGLNFISIVVDSLRGMLQEWVEATQTNSIEQQHLWGARLALLLELCQTRQGAKCVMHANLFRAIEVSGVFAADPELQIDPTIPTALEKYYTLLARTARIIAAAILSRGVHNVVQARRFLTENRSLVTQTLKRSAGITSLSGTDVPLSSAAVKGLEVAVSDLAEAFMVLISATGFLEYEEEQAPGQQGRSGPATVAALYH